MRVENSPFTDGLGIIWIGFDDAYAESGTVEELMEKFGLTAEHVAEAARRAIAAKTIKT